MIRLLRLWWARPVLTSAFLLACALTLFFAVRFTIQTVYFAAHQDEAIQPWMTAGYVGRAWDLDPREIDAIAGLPLPDVKGRPQPLSEIAADRGVPVSEVIADVEAAIAELRAKEQAERAARREGGNGQAPGDGE